MLRVTPDVRDAIFAHALAEKPLESCGMVSAMVVPGTTRTSALGLVDYFHPMRNSAVSATLFELDGQEMLDLERSVEETGRELVGVVHSHTTTSAYPSPTDVRDASRFDPMGTFLHLIVSLRHPEPVVRCFQIQDEEITEVPIEVSDGDEDLHDDTGGAAIAAVMSLPS